MSSGILPNIVLMDGLTMRYFLCSLALLLTAFLAGCTTVKDVAPPPPDTTGSAPKNPLPPGTASIQTVTGQHDQKAQAQHDQKIQALERRVREQDKEITLLRGQLESFKHIELDVSTKKKQKLPSAEAFR
jgi:hypothetical protein